MLLLILPENTKKGIKRQCLLASEMSAPAKGRYSSKLNDIPLKWKEAACKINPSFFLKAFLLINQKRKNYLHSKCALKWQYFLPYTINIFSLKKKYERNINSVSRGLYFNLTTIHFFLSTYSMMFFLKKNELILIKFYWIPKTLQIY